MIEIVWGFVSVIGVISLAVVVRFLQFRRWYTLSLINRNEKDDNPIIFMLDFYQGSPELRVRVERTAELYQKLHNAHCFPCVVTTVGILKGIHKPFAFIDKDLLEKSGIPPDDVRAYIGENFRGAADTFEEVRLMCEYAHTIMRDRRVYVVANSLQAVQAFAICLREGIFPTLETTPVLEESGVWAAGKLFQIVLTFFSPRGNNPLSMAQRFVRRYISNIM